MIDDSQELEAVAAATEAGVVADLARQLAAGTRVETPDGADLVLMPNGAGGTEVIDLQDYAPGPRPSSTRRAMQVFDAASFVTYLNGYGDPSCALVLVDPTRHTLHATLDATEGRGSLHGPGWQHHTLRLQARPTPEWTAWKRSDGKWLTLEEFALHVENQLRDFVDPDGADWLELAQSFQATTNAAFQQGQRLATGETSFQWTEETTAKAGRAGELTIPEAFSLGLTAFEGGQPYKVPARFRYKLRSGQLSVGYRLDRPDLVERACFDEFVLTVRTSLSDDWTILNGPVS